MPTLKTRTAPSRRTRCRRAQAVAVIVLLVASACGGGTTEPTASPTERAGDSATPQPAGEQPAPAPPGDDPPPPAGPDDPPPAPSSQTPPAPDAPSAAPPPAGEQPPPAPQPAPQPAPAPVAAPDPGTEPVYGGTLTFGLEAETPDGWLPTQTQCVISCQTVMRAIFDPLTIEGPSGAPEPYLLESFEANEDFTIWTLRMRPGIRFHDGTPADAAALVAHFEQMSSGTLTGQVLRRLDSVRILDELTVEAHATGPYAGLPANLTGQLGYLAAPSQYVDPEGASNPVGTGPFVFSSWNPNSELVVERNPDYWKTDAEGRSLPYLDKVVFRPIVDSDARVLALRTGDIDVHHTNDPLNAAATRESFKTVEEGSFFQTSYLLLNNSEPPFDDLRARQAVAHCIDYDTFNLLRVGNNTPTANGPFGPNTPGHLPDNGFPTYDPELGRELWQQVGYTEQLKLGTTNDPVNRITTELIASMLGACDISARIEQLDQGTLVLNAVTGNFHTLFWRNHNGAHLENERLWWHSEYAAGLAINFGRINNPDIDAALDASARTADRDELKALAEDINRAFAAGVHNVWLYWSLWTLPHLDGVQNLGLLTLPGGGEILNLIEGRAFLTETWIG